MIFIVFIFIVIFTTFSVDKDEDIRPKTQNDKKSSSFILVIKTTEIFMFVSIFSLSLVYVSFDEF